MKPTENNFKIIPQLDEVHFLLTMKTYHRSKVEADMQRQQILDGLKALEYDALRRKENVELNLENQKLKETIARLDSEKSHIITLYGNLKLENEELKIKYNIEQSNFIITKMHNEDYIKRLNEEGFALEQKIREIGQENDQLKEVSRQRGFTISDLQDHENTLNGQIHELKKKQCWKCGANQEYMNNK